VLLLAITLEKILILAPAAVENPVIFSEITWFEKLEFAYGFVFIKKFYYLMFF